jgi:hypothetical protein
MIITLNQIVGLFKSFATNHPQIEDFGYGQTSEIGVSKQISYPLMWTTHDTDSTIQISNNRVMIPELNFTVLFVDKLNIQSNYQDINGEDSTNGQEVLSDTMQMAEDFIAEILTYYGQYGIMLNEQAVSLFPIQDETDDKVNGWAVRFTLKLKHSNCIPQFGGHSGVTPIPFLPLTCDTLATCTTFTNAIDNLQTQIDNIEISGGTGIDCAQLSGCTIIQEIQNDILSLSANSITCETLVNCEAFSTLQQDVSDIDSNVSTINNDISNINNTISNIEGDITILSATTISLQQQVDAIIATGSSLTCETIEFCPTIQQIQNDISSISGATSDNIYTADGTISTNRVVSLAASNNSLTFRQGSTDILKVNGDATLYLNGSYTSPTYSYRDFGNINIAPFGIIEIRIPAVNYNNCIFDIEAVYSTTSVGTRAYVNKKISFATLIDKTINAQSYSLDKLGSEILNISDFTYNSVNDVYVLRIQHNVNNSRTINVKIRTSGLRHEQIMSATATVVTGTASEVPVQLSTVKNANLYYIGINFQTTDTFTYVAPDKFRINSTQTSPTRTLTIKVNNVTYTLGNTINLFDTVTVETSGVGFAKLNCELLP